MRLPRRRPNRRSPQRRRIQLVLGWAALSTAVASGLVLLTATAGLAEDRAIAVDRQAYVPDAGPDAYEANGATGGSCSLPPCPPDPLDLHVGAAPKQSTYHSLLHVGLSAIPQGDTVSSLVVRMEVTTDTAQDNVNVSSAIIDAFPL